MRFTRTREIFGTLRFRLTLWNTAVVLVAVGLALFGVREGVRLTLQHEADLLLRQDLEEVTLTLEQSFPHWSQAYNELNRMTEAHKQRGMFVQMFDGEGKAWWSSTDAPALDVPGLKVSRGTVPISRGKYRLLQRRLVHPPLPPLTIRVGTVPEFAEAELARLTNIMLAAGVVVLLVAPLGGYLLAGRATRPLARIIDTTGRLHPSCLDERLPLRGSGDELDRLSQTINGFLDRIAAYLRQSREFTANAAHELRSPLAAIQSSLEVALNADRSGEEYKEILGVVLEECGNLAILINQLLLLAESDAGRLPWDPEPVHLDAIVLKAVEMFQGVADAAGVALQCDRAESALVEGNANRLRQVINNLVDNALKFTPPGGRVSVSLSNSEGQVCLRVTDTGAGIPPEDLPHIFERFYRGDKARPRERKARGTGLGLAICRSVVTAHGGTIMADSRLGAGATFTVRLPRAYRTDGASRRRPAGTGQATPAARAEDRGPRIAAGEPRTH
jgi:heavy metal sensor kinase